MKPFQLRSEILSAFRSASAQLMIFCALSGGALGSPPANDNFSARTILSGTAVVDVTGDNTEATLEGGEVDPGDSGGASVWYEWMAPASGWVTIHTSAVTAGNGLDTVLAVFTGSSLGSLQMLGHNDESHRGTDFSMAIYPEGFGPSRLVFQATAGTVYQIAVHGWYDSDLDEVAQGPFELHIAAEPQPAVRVTALSATPDPVIVTSASQTGALLATVESDASIDTQVFGIVLNRPDGGSDYFQGIQSSDRISGSGTNGSYSRSFDFPRYLMPGDWPLALEVFGGPSGSSRWTARGEDLTEDDYLMAPGADGRLTVVNTGTADIAGPQVTAFSASPTSVNVADASQNVTVTMTITDDHSGFGYASLSLQTADLANFGGSAPVYESNRISGNGTNGVYQVTVSVPQGTVSGTYHWNLSCQDKALNNTWLSGGENHPLLADDSITVTGVNPPANDDFSARINLGSALPSSASGTNRGATLEASETYLSGYQSGAAQSSVWYSWTATATGWVSVDTVGSNFDTILGVFAGASIGSLSRIGFNDHSAWQSETASVNVSRLHFKATAGTTYQIAVYGWQSERGDFDLHIASTPPPHEVTAMTFTPSTVDVTSASQSVTVDINVLSDSDLPFFTLEMWGSGPPERQNFSYLLGAGHRISGTPTNGTYRINISIPRYTVPESKLFRVLFSDLPGVTAWHSAGGDNLSDNVVLNPAIPTTVTVLNSGPSDITAPTLTAVSGFPAVANVGSSAATFFVDLTATDGMSGVERGYIDLYDANGNFAASAPVFPSHLISGTVQNGVWRVPFTIPQNTSAGVYYPLFGLYDATFNEARFTDRPGAAAFGDLPVPPVETILSIQVNNTSGFAAWRASKFTPTELADPNVSGPNADAEKDGLPNALEYALGLEPKTADTTPWTSSISMVATTSYLTLTFSLPAAFPGDATVTVEESSTLGSGAVWTPRAMKSGTSAWIPLNGGVVTVGPESGGRVPVSVRSPNAIGGANQSGFMHLVVTLP